MSRSRRHYEDTGEWWLAGDGPQAHVVASKHVQRRPTVTRPSRKTHPSQKPAADVTAYSAEVQELSHLLPALWRGLTRATPASENMPVLESQVTVLRKLVAAGPMSPAQLADELYLARSTISNILRELVDDGMIERRASPLDGRSVVVTPTDYGSSTLEQFRVGRADVLRSALNGLEPDDLESIRAALPGLARLLQAIDRAADEVELAASPRDASVRS
jgi:DNA-binding MarR family transcriptional regulator